MGDEDERRGHVSGVATARGHNLVDIYGGFVVYGVGAGVGVAVG